MTERGLEGALMFHTKAIVANPASFSLPGWVSVEKALSYLKGEMRGVSEGPMRAFLTAAGAVV